MPLSRRKKLTLTLLLLYWPTFFILAHIPIPVAVRGVSLSDKTLHVIAYMTLTFLIFTAIWPSSRVNWRKPPVWLIILLVVFYGVMDELIQAKVGRTADIHDFYADLVGSLIGLVLLTALPFWTAFMAVVAIAVFALSNLTQSNVAELFPITNAIFHIFAYALFTALWIRNMRFHLAIRPQSRKWLPTTLALPIALLAAVSLSSLILQKPVQTIDILISLAAIIITTALHRLTATHS